MGQKVNPLIYRVALNGFWRLKIYPSNLSMVLIKQFIVYKIMRSFFRRYKFLVTGFKYKVTNNNNLYIYLYKNKFNFRLRAKPHWILDSFLNYHRRSITSELEHIKDINNKEGQETLEAFKLLSCNWTFKFKYQVFISERKSVSKNDIIFKGLRLSDILLSSTYKDCLINYILYYTFYKDVYILFKLLVLWFFLTISDILYTNNILINNFYLFNSVVSSLKGMSYFNMYLFFKVRSVELECILMDYLKVPLNIYLFNISRILTYKRFNNVPKHSKMFLSSGLFYFNDFVRCFFFSMHLKNSHILSYIISRHITNKKNHFYYIRNVKRLVKYLIFYEKTPYFLGLRITVHGKFKGILRKRKLRMFEGYRSLHRLNNNISYCLHRVFTRYGVFSIKVWMFFLADEYSPL